MKILVSMIACLLSVSAFAGSITIKMPTTQTIIVPSPATARTCTNERIQGPFTMFNEFAVEYSGDGTFQLNLFALKLAGPDLSYAKYDSILAGDDLSDVIDTTPITNGKTNASKCPLYFGNINITEGTTFAMVEGYIKVMGTETDGAGNVRALNAQVAVSLSYEAFKK